MGGSHDQTWPGESDTDADSEFLGRAADIGAGPGQGASMQGMLWVQMNETTTRHRKALGAKAPAKRKLQSQKEELLKRLFPALCPSDLYSSFKTRWLLISLLTKELLCLKNLNSKLYSNLLKEFTKL